MGQRLGDIEAADAQLIAIGNGHEHWARAFVEQEGVRFPVYVDPGRNSYEQFDMKRGVSEVLGARSLKHSLRAMSRGHFQSQTRGDPLQNGGVVVLDANGEIVYEHVEDEAGDLADLEEVMASLG